MGERATDDHTDKVRELLLEIARCPVARSCLTSPTDSHCCQPIVSVQRGHADSFHVPEPWSGQLTKAPILFLSSNPSIDLDEEYPTLNWSDEGIIDFFSNRFSGGEKEWAQRGVYPRRRNGRSPKTWVRFFASARARAAEVLMTPRNKVRPGIDYVLSEVVHCKSRNESGVKEAMEECPGRYLDRVVCLSSACIVVCFGERAAEAACATFGIPNSVPDAGRLFGPIDIGGVSRIFAFLPHPNARRVPKSFDAWIGAAGIQRMRNMLDLPSIESPRH